MSGTAKFKNIILCFDGTGDWAGTDSTNVMKLYERLEVNESQIRFYAGGVGTLGSPLALTPWNRAFLKILDLATATTLRDKVLEGYSFLVENYEPGDKIFMYGFSRGAFTARVLASLLHNFGLLRKEHANVLQYLWQTISQFRSFSDFLKDAALIKKQFSIDEPGFKIHFVGLFDTVSSVGIFERFNVYPFTDRNPSIAYVRHAVSIDEQRNAFPELLVVPAGNDVKEVWFPGVHRDVGGGADDHPGLSNETLNWILEESAACGLLVDTKPAPTNDKRIHYAPFDPFAFVGLYPMKMFDYALVNRRYGDPGFRWFWPKFRHKRHLPTNAFRFIGNGMVERAGKQMPLADAKTDEPPVRKPPQYSLIDAIGTLIGVALAFVVMYRGLGTWRSNDGFSHLLLDLGPAWPEASRLPWLTWSSACAFWLLLLFVIHQAFWQRIAVRASNGINIVIQAVWLAIAVAVIAAFWMPWTALGIGVVAGLLVTIVSQAGRLPILRADRAIGYFMVPWFLIVLGHWIVISLGSLVWPYTLLGLQFLFLGNHLLFWIEPAAIYFCWMLVAIGAIAGLINIIRDRQMMVGDPVTSARARQAKEELVRSVTVAQKDRGTEDHLTTR